MPTLILNLTEPKSPRYIYLDPLTNRIHLMLPIVSGPEGIGLDNTCKAAYAMQEFFGKRRVPKAISALDSLRHYQETLRFDIEYLHEDCNLKDQKRERLQQVIFYISLLEKMNDHPLLDCLDFNFPEYPQALRHLLKEKEANLYSMILRPRIQDTYLRTVNPTFSLAHDTHNSQGERIIHNSSCHRILEEIYSTIDLKSTDKKTKLIEDVLASNAGRRNHFEGIQQELSTKVQERFGENINFSEMSKTSIDSAMGFGRNEPAKNYIEVLLGYCAPYLFEYRENQSPFESIDPGTTASDLQQARERLSILTQFFLAQVNIYCVANQKTKLNFGELLEKYEELAREVASRVKSSLLNHTDVEATLLDFINKHLEIFELTAALSQEEKETIKQKFRLDYAQIKDSPHFDEFMVLDISKPGLFVIHQGAICTDLAEFVHAAIAEDSQLTEWNHFYLERLRGDFKAINGKLAPENLLYTHKEQNLKIKIDFALITDDGLRWLTQQLAIEDKKRLYAMPEINLRLLSMLLPDFLHLISRGKQRKAKELLKSFNAEDRQRLLLDSAQFTDYSGRTFDCTAFEYTYWTKDTYMARMLLKFMSVETKAQILEHIVVIEQEGLAYRLNGELMRSKHFDFLPLKNAYIAYRVVFYTNPQNQDAIDNAWLKIGKEQRLLPIHVIHEYCHPDRPLYPCPNFTSPYLPRNIIIYNDTTDTLEPCFPLSPDAGLGFEFSLLRANHPAIEVEGATGVGFEWEGAGGEEPNADFVAINHLDKVRSAELILLREQLALSNNDYKCGCLCSLQ